MTLDEIEQLLREMAAQEEEPSLEQMEHAARLLLPLMAELPEGDRIALLGWAYREGHDDPHLRETLPPEIWTQAEALLLPREP